MKVFLAMSSGIDSSTCLFLLKQQGYDVRGITLRLDDDYDGPIQKSKHLCNKFGVEHIVLDYRKEFKKEVVEKFCQQIQMNLTPVPCIYCNRTIKLGKLLDYCLEQGAKLATGHYARIEDNKIYRAKDILKDQTHFLCDIKKESIKNLFFPLGNYLKSDVFRIAEKNNLVCVDKYKESQDVCFFNGKTYKQYIQGLNIVEKEGDILHIENNKKLGRHNGLLKYTIGQRQGFGVAWNEPLYVIKRDNINNILYVGEDRFLYSKSLCIKNVNILVDDFQEKKKFQCKVCLRDKTPFIDSVIYFDKDKSFARIELLQQVRAITRGQWCSMYVDDLLIGGGEIE